MSDDCIPGLHVPGDPAPESRFIAPTSLCPHPERWTSTDGDSTEVEVSDLAYGLVCGLQPSFCLETGSGFGQTSRRIGEALKANGQGRLAALEIDPGRAVLTANACAGLPVDVYAEDSLTFVPELEPGETIDFAWLDSFYEHRVPEFQRLRRWMRAGTIVCFHDTAPEHGSHRIPSGRALRDEIEAELAELLRVVHLPTPRGVTIAAVK